MFWPQYFFAYYKRSLEERFCLDKFVLSLIEGGEVGEAGGSIGMVGTKNLFVNGKGMLEKRFSFGIEALILIEGGEVSKAGGSIGMVRTKNLFANGESTL